jgi:pimeloyl-ACP methyl ester carboxylesterase
VFVVRVPPLHGGPRRPLAPGRARLPGFGYSGTPARADFAYTFDAYADFLARFVDELALERYAIYLHDYGSQFGLRLALRDPERVAALIIQNGDIYEDETGPKYQWLRSYWDNPTDEGREQMASNVSEEGFREEFLNDVRPDLAERISPALWKLHWSLMPPQDGYMPQGAARAYLRDLPNAELHLLDGGHWALETNLDEVIALARDFLGRVHT